MAEALKNELAEAEKEIATIKATLRLLGPAGEGSSEAESNSLSIFLLKMEGLPEGAKPTLQLQLSSPVEEASVSEVFNPALEEVPENMKATFRGAETGQATLTVSAKDADIPLGSSEPLDLSLLTEFDAMSSKKEYIVEKAVPILAEGQTEGDPVCTASLQILYEPSAAERREQLYDKLAVATKKKSAVVEKLRQASHDNRQMATRPAGPPSPAVKPGFLNKAKKEPEPSKLQVWMDRFNRYLGPESIVRKAKNYFIFFGTMAFFHFQGHALALPPPV
mmetsp:Transcript_12287/g.16085  ORF Transcript_12287/g.16085 Transcript_12287/m.16085 type:complete len:278 (-) Transcript_12287:183-1016(-)|eukprot:CAMPEP_0198144184 /NCGR_PEP_ID=MMETSP1443-20131203/13909_1 /TAXON_ID=186043 /ORGANISM="Entomoneis sp., Strain CCMP2396" /LENGTH=277 /DNA_ID=CAMNT_0043807537 /DNA_START=73 /DNA_END=906 /DNA_ORIENTATION=+